MGELQRSVFPIDRTLPTLTTMDLLFRHQLESQLLQSGVLLEYCHGDGEGLGKVKGELDPGRWLAEDVATVLGGGRRGGGGGGIK